MRNTTPATPRRLPIPTVLAVLLALAALMSLIGAAPAQTTTDYDTDNDGYIEVSTHAQLNVIRHDMDGNGDPTSGCGIAVGERRAVCGSAAATRMGCPGGACVGYELTANINLDTNGNGSHDSGDTYYNGGAGWDTIGSDATKYAANFKGNRFAVQNLTISRSGSNDQALFGSTEPNTRIESVGVTNANVTAAAYAGALVGASRSAIVAC